MRANMIPKSMGKSLFAGMILLCLVPASSWAKAGKETSRILSPPAPQRLSFAQNLIPSEGLENTPRVEGSESLISRKKGPTYQSDEGFYESLSPEEKAGIKSRSKRWENLPPEKRRELERRMNQWKQLSPEEKDLMRKRHQQWQELSPGERDRIREELKRWDSLSPQEQDDIRRKFKRP